VREGLDINNINGRKALTDCKACEDERRQTCLMKKNKRKMTKTKKRDERREGEINGNQNNKT